MSVKLELEISLNSKGAVEGVRTLNSEVDKLGQTSQKTGGSAGGLFQTIVGGVTAANLLQKAIEELIVFVKDSAKAYVEAERQQSKLNVVSRRYGEDVKVANESITAFADKMEYLTGVDDLQIKSLEILARQYGIHKDRIDESIKGAIALTEIGGSLESNLKAISNAYNGNWMMLNRLIPEIQAANTDSEKMDILQRKLAEGFEISTEAMKGSAGRILELENAFHKLKISVGEGIVEGLHLFDMALLGNKQMVKDWAREMATAKQRFDDLAAANINRFRSSSGLKSTASPSQLGFIDIESDLAAGADQAKNYESAIDAATKAQDDFNASQEKSKIALENTMKAADAALEEMFGLEQNTKDAEAAAEASQELGGAWKIDSTAADWLQQNVDRLNGKVKENAAAENLAFRGAQDLAAGLQAIASAFDRVIPGLGDLVSGVMGAFSSFKDLQKQIAAGTATFGSFLGTAGAVVTAVFAVNDAVQEYLKNQRVNFIVGMNESIAVTKDLAKEIEALAQKYYDVTAMGDVLNSWDAYAAATSESLGEIIANTNMTVETFNNFAIRTREILSDLDRGTITTADAIAFMGDAFDSLIVKAKELGTEGSASLLTFFDDLASRGLEVAEVTKYINEQWAAGLDGYKLMKASMDPGDLYERYDQLVESMRGMRVGSQEYKNALGELDALQAKIVDVKNAQDVFGGMNVQIFEQLIAYEKKVGENQALIDGIHGATQAFVSMSNATRLTEGEFDQFEKSAASAYEKLRKQGFTEKESLLELAPMLSRMIFLNKEYGLKIDATTQAMIDKAKADGIDLTKMRSQDEMFGVMADSLEELVKIFRDAFPAAIDKSTEALKRLNKNAPDINVPTGPGRPNPRRPDEEPAAAGWQGWVTGPKRFLAGEGNEPEYVSITPQSKMRGSDAAPGGRVTNINVYIKEANSPETAASNIITAWRGNVRGLRSVLSKGVN